MVFEVDLTAFYIKYKAKTSPFSHHVSPFVLSVHHTFYMSSEQTELGNFLYALKSLSDEQ